MLTLFCRAMAHPTFLPFLILFLTAGQASAWDSFIGQESCAFVVQRMQEDEESATLIIAAFVSGVNYATDRMVDADIGEMASWVRGYCERDPSARFLDALLGLDEELEARQVPNLDSARVAGK